MQMWALKLRRNGVFPDMFQSMLLLLLLTIHKVDKNFAMENSWAPNNTLLHPGWKVLWKSECYISRWAGHCAILRGKTRKAWLNKRGLRMRTVKLYLWLVVLFGLLFNYLVPGFPASSLISHVVRGVWRWSPSLSYLWKAKVSERGFIRKSFRIIPYEETTYYPAIEYWFIWFFFQTVKHFQTRMPLMC